MEGGRLEMGSLFFSLIRPNSTPIFQFLHFSELDHPNYHTNEELKEGHRTEE